MGHRRDHVTRPTADIQETTPNHNGDMVEPVALATVLDPLSDPLSLVRRGREAVVVIVVK
jgi:hypothetical protein